MDLDEIACLHRPRPPSTMGPYSSNLITKKEPKSDDRLSKFDWHDISPIFSTVVLLNNLKVF